MTLRLPLAKNSFATFVSVYSPILDSTDDVNDHIYDTLYSTHAVIGHHGVGNMNDSGLGLLALSSELGFAITNTFFQYCDMHKTSWMHPRYKHWHFIDYVIVRRRDLNEV